MSKIWAGLFEWADALTKSEAAILGAIGTAALAGFGKYVFLPASSWLLKKIGRLLYPIASGAFLLDQIWALPKYLNMVDESCGRLRNPWLEEGQHLSEIFVPVSAIAGDTDSKRMDLKYVFERHQRTVIVGDPGSGKSTGLRAIALDCINGRISKTRNVQYVPVFIELRRFAKANVSLDEYVVEVFQENGFPNPRRMIARLRRQGRLAFLLDALDEVEDEERSNVLTQLRSFFTNIQGETGNRVVLTSRPVGYNEQLRDLVDETYQMADFIPADMREFIRNWRFRPPKSQEMLLKVLAERPPILEICRNPLMLTIVTSLYKETDYQLPDSREEFFRICIDALLRRWDEARELDKRNRHPPGLKEAFLQELSFRTLVDGFKPLAAWSLLKEVEVFLESRNRDPNEAEAFLNEIVRSGLLGRLPTNEIYFAHKTFAESLCSFYLRTRSKDLVLLWNKSPEVWLEVCSLFVSDFRCTREDIDLFLSDALARNDWSGLLTLAGEAHVCPDQYRHLILSRLQTDHQLWTLLDRRAIGSIARLGKKARNTLTTMLKDGPPEIKKLTIYALGLSREQWALDLVVGSLTGSTKRTAIEALSSLGEPVVPILEDLIRTRRQNKNLMSACIAALSGVGSTGSTASILPLIWSETTMVRTEAAKAVVDKLGDSEHVRVIDSEARKPEAAQLEKVRPLMSWAVPWLKGRTEVVCGTYCRLIKSMSELAPTIGQSTPLIVIPALIEAWSPNSDPKAIYIYKLATVSANSIHIAKKLLNYSQNRARQAWSNVYQPVSTNINLSGEGFLIGYSIVSLITILMPVVWHIKIEDSSQFLFIPIALWLLNGLYLSLHEKYRSLFWFTGFLIVLGCIGMRIMKRDEIGNSFHQITMWMAVLGTFGSVGVAALQLGSLWVLCLAPLLISVFIRINENEHIIMRNNLMHEFLDRLEGIRRMGPGLKLHGS